jgi:hypothetical protein
MDMPEIPTTASGFASMLNALSYLKSFMDTREKTWKANTANEVYPEGMPNPMDMLPGGIIRKGIVKRPNYSPFTYSIGDLADASPMTKDISGWFNPRTRKVALSPELHVHEALRQEAEKRLKQPVTDEEFLRFRRIARGPYGSPGSEGIFQYWSPERAASHTEEQQIALDALDKLRKAGLVQDTDDLRPQWKFK